MFWRGLVGYLPVNIVQGLVGLLTLLIFTRLLSAEDFGRYALAFSAMTLSHVLVFTWIEAAMARFLAAATTPQDRADHFRTLYAAFARLTLLYLPVTGLVVAVLPIGPQLKTAVAVAVLSVPVRAAFRLVQERRRAAGEVAPAARDEILMAVGGFAIGIVAALSGLGAASPFVGLALAPLLLLPFMAGPDLGEGRHGTYRRTRLGHYATYGYPIAASLILTLVLSSTDRFLLAALMDEAAVGAYHAGYSLANRTLDVIFVWLGAAGGPALVMALERGGRPEMQAAARTQASVFVLIGLPAAAGLVLVAAPLSQLMLGEAVRDGAIAIVGWIAVAALLGGLTTYYFHQAFTLSRRTGQLLIAMAVPAAANVALNLILIPLMGLLGAAVATALSLAVGLAASWGLGRRALPLPLALADLGKAGLGCIAMVAAVSLVPAMGGLAELMLKAGIGAAVYGLVVWLVDAAGVRSHGSRLLKGLVSGSTP